MNRYWIYEGGDPEGPLTVEEIINRDDWAEGYFCRVGEEEWNRPEEFDDLAEKLEELKPDSSPPEADGPPDVPEDIRKDTKPDSPSEQPADADQQTKPTQTDAQNQSENSENAPISQKKDQDIHAPFVARKTEIEQLSEILQGNSEAVCGIVTGEGGIGKSRLVSEALANHKPEELDLLTIQGDPYSDHNPYSSVLKLFDRALDINPNERPVGREEIKNNYGIKGSLAKDLSIVYGISQSNVKFSLREDDQSSSQKNRQDRARRLAKFLYKSFEDSPCVVYLDDVQWIEPSSIELIEKLIKQHTEQQVHRELQKLAGQATDEEGRIYILMTSRNVGVDPSAGDEAVRRLPGEPLEHEDQTAPLENILDFGNLVKELNLEPLDESEINHMIKKTFPDAEPDDSVIQDLIEKTNGVVLHLEQALWSLVELGILETVDEEAWSINSYNPEAVPSSLEDLIVSRVQRLNEIQTKTLTTASVLGASFERWLIVDILSDYNEEDVDGALYKLLSKRFLRSQEGHYIFQHTTIQDMTYEQLDEEERQKLHSRAANLIREHKNENDPVIQDRLVRHYRGAKQWAEVLKFRMDRIEQALRSHELKEAKGFIEEIEEAGWPQDLDDILRARYLRARGILSYREFDEEDALEELTTSAEMFDELDEKEEYAQCLYWQGKVNHRQGELESAEEIVRTALDIFEEADNHEGRALCYRELGNLSNRQGRTEMANRYFERALEINEMMGADVAQARDLYHLGKMKEVKQGNLEEAENYYRRSLKKLSGSQSDQFEASNYTSLGRVARKQGNYEKAEDLLKNSLEVYEEIGDAAGCAFTYRALAQLSLQQGAQNDAYDFYKQSYEIEEKLSNHTGMGYASAGMAECAQKLGNLEQANSHVDDAIEYTREVNDTKNLAYSYSIKAKIAREQEDYADAIKWLTKSLELNREIGRDSSRAFLLSLRGDIKREVGDLDAAKENYKRSLEINDMLERPESKASNFWELGKIEQDLGNDSSARSYYKQAVNILNDLELSEIPDFIISVYDSYGSLSLSEGKVEEARQAFDRLVSIYEQREEPISRAEAMGNLGRVKVRRGNTAEARDLFESALSIIEPHEPHETQHFLKRQLGKLNEDQQNFDRAQNCYEVCLELAKNMDANDLLSTSYGDLGQLAQKLEEYEKAEDLYMKSLKLSKNDGNKMGQSISLNKLGKLYTSNRKWDEANACFEQALELSREVGDKQIEAICVERLGNIARKKNEPDEAESFYQQALDINVEQNNDQGQSVVLNKLGTLSLECGELEKARNYFTKALELVEMINYDYGQAINLSELGVVHRLHGDYTQSRKKLTRALEINQEIDNTKSISANCYELAHVYEIMNEPNQVEQFLDQAVESLREVEFNSIERKITLLRARLAASNGSESKAREHVDRAKQLLTPSVNPEPFLDSIPPDDQWENLEEHDILYIFTELMIQRETTEDNNQIANHLDKFEDQLDNLVSNHLLGKEFFTLHQLKKRYFPQETVAQT